MDRIECDTSDQIKLNENEMKTCELSQEISNESTNEDFNNFNTSQISSTSRNLEIDNSGDNEEIKSHATESENNEIQSSRITSHSQSTTLSLKKTKLKRIMILNDDDSDDEDEMNNSDIFKDERISDEEKSDENNIIDDLETMKARSLIKNAVIIEPSIKRKKRVLESDDEEAFETTLDDIGIIEDNNEIEIEEVNNEIIIEEPPIVNNDIVISEKIEIMENLDEFDENERLYKELESIKPIDENE